MHPATGLLAKEQRDKFVARAASTRIVYAVAGEEGLARSASRTFRAREVALLWSEREAAESWAPSVAGKPRLKELTLVEVLGSMLPALAEHQRLVGVDWTGEGTQPEHDPRDLAERIRLAGLEHFLSRVSEVGVVWTLEESAGPAMLVSSTQQDGLVMPCWSERELAESRIRGPWSDALATAIPLDSFLGGRLAWLERQEMLVAPDHYEAPGALEIEAVELRQRLIGALAA